MFTLQFHVTKFIQTRYVITITYYENNENKRKLLYPTYIRSFIAINKIYNQVHSMLTVTGRKSNTDKLSDYIFKYV